MTKLTALYQPQRQPEAAATAARPQTPGDARDERRIPCHDIRPPHPRRLDDVPGWFWPLDQLLFTRVLEGQTAAGSKGDLLELGTYLGRSAILMGRHRQSGELFTICDLFDSDAPDEANAEEMADSYRKTLTRRAFEANYLAFHSELPEIVQAPTAVLQDGRVAAGSCRFAHIDASHLYEHVAGDVQVARAALGKDGVVSFDDYRSVHTPAPPRRYGRRCSRTGCGRSA